MPRNTKGGNKAKKGANKNYVEKKVEEPTEGQYIGIVTKYLGNSRCDLTYIRNRTNEITKSIERTQMNVRGLVRGSVKKRVRLTNGDLVLLSPRDFQDTVVDILVKYSDSEIYKLKKLNLIENEIMKMRNNIDTKSSNTNTTNNVLDETQNDEDDHDYFEDNDEDEQIESKKIRKKNITNYQDIYNIDMSSEEEESYGSGKVDEYGNFIDNI